MKMTFRSGSKAIENHVVPDLYEAQNHIDPELYDFSSGTRHIDMEMYFVDKKIVYKFVDEIKNVNIIVPNLYGCFYHIDTDLYI